jgi:hypothetical protein
MNRKEAIERIKYCIGKQAWALDEIDTEALYEVIPELRESEDERIRKIIYNCVYECCVTGYLLKDDRDSVVAWLQKREGQKPLKVGENAYFDPNTDMWFIKKEQKSAEWDEIQSEFKNINEAFEDGKKEVVDNPEKYGLCKPTEWSEEDEKVLNSIIAYIETGNIYATSKVNMKVWLKSLRPQSKQEWDEFDEDCLKRAIWYVENPAPSVVKDTNLVLWLKSLPGRFNLQPKQEWSEEDENMVKMILGDLEWERRNTTVDKDIRLYDEKIAWLKSLRPQPHWKPSEEQKDGLFHACNRMTGDYYHNALVSLYEDLKKLMEE